MAARELAAALDLTYRRADDGNFDHSVAILLLDADGVVAYRQTGLKQDTQEFVSRIKGLESRPSSSAE
jgi:cytochrome oxidase Cu insertion factor (SCO1/SenC/PrrC family)